MKRRTVHLNRYIKSALNFLLIGLTIPVFAAIQPGDSLMGKLAKIAPEKKVSNLLDILENHHELSNQTIIEYAEEAVNWDDALTNDQDLARLYNFLGNSYYNIGSFDQSLASYQNSLRLAMRIGEKKELGNLMQKIGIVYFNKVDYKRALLYFQQTLKIFQELQFPIREAELYTNIGSIYYRWEEYQKAFDNFDQAYHIYQSLDHLPSMENLDYLKGLTLQKMGNYNDAIGAFDGAMIINNKLQNKNEIAKIYNAIGQVYLEQKDLSKALTNFNLAYQLQQQIGDSIIMAQSLNNLGNVYKELGDFKKSEENLNFSLKIAQKLDLPLTIMDNYKSLYELNYLENNSKEALSFYQKYVSQRDSLFNEKSMLSHDHASIPQSENELLGLKKQLLVLQEKFTYLLYSSAGMVGFLVLLLFFQRAKVKKLRRVKKNSFN